MLNLLVPGAGLFYLGHRRAGLLLAFPFLACCGLAVTWLVQGMARYYAVATSDAILQEGALEQLRVSFPVGKFVLVAVAATVLQGVALWWFEVAARRAGGGAGASPR
jgi:hypothetical protein